MQELRRYTQRLQRLTRIIKNGGGEFLISLVDTLCIQEEEAKKESESKPEKETSPPL